MKQITTAKLRQISVDFLKAACFFTVFVLAAADSSDWTAFVGSKVLAVLLGLAGMLWGKGYEFQVEKF